MSRAWRKLDEGEWNDRLRLRLEEECMVLLAGGIAEKRARVRISAIVITGIGPS